MTAKPKKTWRVVFGFIIVLLVLIVAIKLPDFRAYQKRIAIFPLTKGTYWIYQGPTKWTLDNSNKVLERTLTWKMEVLETIQQGQYFIAIVKGHPGDLAWYEEGKERGDYLLIRKGVYKYYLAFDKLREAVLNSVKTNPQKLDELLTDDDAYIDLPLKPGKKWGDPDQVARDDNAYCWYVESEKKVTLTGISGIASNQTATQYQLRYYTNPDHEVIKFVEGIGITDFAYVHHGTVAEADLHLIEFHTGKD
jgi:hypothetical protein